jgi:CRISPR-associated protein Cas5d
MFERRAAKGQCHAQPYLGCREFAAEFRPATREDIPIALDASLGRMLYDIALTPTGRQSFFFRAELKAGVMNTRPSDVLADEAVRSEVLACSYKR